MGFWNFIFGNSFDEESAEELDPKTSNVSNLYSQNGVFLHTDKNSFKISYNDSGAYINFCVFLRDKPH